MRYARARAWTSMLLLAAAAACGGGGEEQTAGSAAVQNPLLDPRSEAMTRTAPDTFRAVFETSRGSFTVEVRRDWAPNGADRFYNLVSNGFYDGVRFFRVIEGFMAQFGLNGDPQVTAAWRAAPIPDDPVVASNTRGTIT
ncbi:MAG TPA: peptidylprolyl isomerase, partial [Longimicrobiales bacterium]|nr:peptidylprolyl isomerase [Longimicrobiales bacterium]